MHMVDLCVGRLLVLEDAALVNRNSKLHWLPCVDVGCLLCLRMFLVLVTNFTNYFVMEGLV